jgi:hypothetical protein
VALPADWRVASAKSNNFGAMSGRGEVFLAGKYDLFPDNAAMQSVAQIYNRADQALAEVGAPLVGALSPEETSDERTREGTHKGCPYVA